MSFSSGFRFSVTAITPRSIRAEHPDAAKAAVELALSKFGALNVLVNNAAYRNTHSIADADPAQ